MSTSLEQALDAITRVHGVRGAMLVAQEDGLIVAEAVMEGIRTNAVAALAASLAQRFRKASEKAGVGEPRFLHLQAKRGSVLTVPAPEDVLVVVIAEPNVNIGLVKLEMQRVAGAIA